MEAPLPQVIHTNTFSPPTKKFTCSNVAEDFSIRNLMAPIEVKNSPQKKDDHAVPKISVQYIENMSKKNHVEPPVL